MYIASIDQPLIVRFPVVNAGALVPGLLAGAFTVTVLNPAGVALAPAATVSESAKLGVYAFTVPQAFFATGGAGDYNFTVEVGAPGPTTVLSDVIAVVDRPGEIQVSVTYDAAANTLRAHSWLLRADGQATTGLSNGTFRLYDRTGTALTALSTTAAVDAQGVFAFNVPAPAFAIGQTETYVVATVADAGPPSRVWRTVVGVTFSRTS